VKATAYGFNGNTPLFDAPDWSSRVNWMTVAEFGWGGWISKEYRLGWRVSAGGALASETVNSPFGSDSKIAWGQTVDLGISYDFTPRWSFTADYRWVHLNNRNFSPALGGNFDLDRSINMWLFGIRYTFRSTLRKEL
jgi:opacity protein-like surface antigen